MTVGHEKYDRGMAIIFLLELLTDGSSGDGSSIKSNSRKLIFLDKKTRDALESRVLKLCSKIRDVTSMRKGF